MELLKIESRDNPKIKNLKKLGMKKYRERSSEFLVENFKIILDALKSGVKPRSVFVTSEFAEKNQDQLMELIKQDKFKKVFEINNLINKSFSELDTPSGIAAVYEIVESRPINDKGIVVYLNGVGDPGNLGTILRSALAFGISEIVLDETCAEVYNPKVINSAKDAIFNLNINYDHDLEVLNKIKAKMPIVVTAMQADDDLNKIKKNKKMCLVLGGESRGVSSEIASLADQKIKINMSNKIESLNVASAAAIIFHELYN